MTLPFAWLSFTGWSPLSSAVKSGASLPALISGPPRVIGLPLNITAPALSAMLHLRVGCGWGTDSPADELAVSLHQVLGVEQPRRGRSARRAGSAFFG